MNRIDVIYTAHTHIQYTYCTYSTHTAHGFKSSQPALKQVASCFKNRSGWESGSNIYTVHTCNTSDLNQNQVTFIFALLWLYMQSFEELKLSACIYTCRNCQPPLIHLTSHVHVPTTHRGSFIDYKKNMVHVCVQYTWT